MLHLYAVLFDFEAINMDRAELMNKLRDEGVGTQVHYLPVHMQPYYMQRYGDINLAGSLAYYDRVLSLPLYPGMNDNDVDFVIEKLSLIINT